jgi:hypothetical protein
MVLLQFIASQADHTATVIARLGADITAVRMIGLPA